MEHAKAPLLDLSMKDGSSVRIYGSKPVDEALLLRLATASATGKSFAKTAEAHGAKAVVYRAARATTHKETARLIAAAIGIYREERRRRIPPTEVRIRDVHPERALDQARWFPERSAMRALVREHGWRLWAVGGTAEMRKVYDLAKTAKAVATLNKWWDRIGNDADMWLA